METRITPTGRVYRRTTDGVWWMDFHAAGKRYRRSTGWRDAGKAIAALESTRNALLVAKAEHMTARIALARVDGWAVTAATPWVRTMLTQAKRNAKRRRIEFLLTVDDLVALLLASGGHCAVTGIPFSDESVAGWHPYTASLDRVESAGHYTAANCRIVCCAANMACHAWGEDVFRKVARAMVAGELLAANRAQNRHILTSTDAVN